MPKEIRKQKPPQLSLRVSTARDSGRHRRSKKLVAKSPPTPPLPHKLTDRKEEEAPKRTKKRWTVNECRRLKLALKIAKPLSDTDWEGISRSIGGQRTAAECRAKAIKQFDWKQPPLGSPSAQMATTSQSAAVAAADESDPYSQYFRDNVDFSLGELDLDDTLLNDAYASPTEPVRCMRRPFLLRPIDPFEDERATKDNDED